MDFGLATTNTCSSDFGRASYFYVFPGYFQTNSEEGSFYESAPSDDWSLGVILVNLTCGRNLWKRASADDK
ncbi:hypothetical protein BDV23DRAFT_182680 [Aspergillus alliaceus]|uniref:Protein kinase domain-containing protein n=1 Tax=Petromyces alliaceus TaxID=209559 RepID=A0A5N7CB55_PETAA|nr:hypothetical protein BDV23DRAFT_182680 [Aspergillus alliaceus]